MVTARIAFLGMSMIKDTVRENTTYELTKYLLRKGYGVTWIDNSPHDSVFAYDIPDGCMVEKLEWGETPISLVGINKRDLLTFGLKSLYDKSSLYRADLDALVHAMEACKADIVIAWGTLATRYALDTVVAGTTVLGSLTRNPKRDLGLHILEHDKLMKNYMMRVRHFHTPTLSLLDNFEKKYQRKFTTIPHRVPPSEYTANPRGVEGEKKYVAYAGELIESADVDALIYAFHSLMNEFPEWNLRIIGEGPEEKGLEAAAHARAMTGRVDFIDANKCFDKYLEDAQIFVSPSTYDAFPGTLSLAASVGLPLIATSEIPMVHKIVKTGLNGEVIPELKKTQGLTQALRDLMGDPDKRERYGSLSKTILANEFGNLSTCEKWEDLIVEVTPMLRARA